MRANVSPKGTYAEQFAEEAAEAFEKDGTGFTVNPWQRTPSKGFMVALKGREQVVNLDEDHDTYALFHAYAEKHMDDLSLDHMYMGGWLNERDGRLYLDVAVWVADRWSADALAILNEQKAFYDLSTHASVYVS